MKRFRMTLSVFLLIIFIIIFFFSLYHIIIWVNDNQKTNKQIQSLQEHVKLSKSKESGTVEVLDNTKYHNVDLLSVDFTDLLSKNPNTVGWIQIPETNVNYPFVQYKDNSYYLSHSFDDSNNTAGWLFLDYRNQLDSMDMNTIIYAHGRVDGTMFGTLKDILSDDWMKLDKNYIRISTLNYNYLFEMFSAYHIKTTNDYLKINYNNLDEYQKFLDLVKQRSMVDFSTNVNTSNKILTLSTCYNSSEKMVVHAKLVKQEKRY